MHLPKCGKVCKCRCCVIILAILGSARHVSVCCEVSVVIMCSVDMSDLTVGSEAMCYEVYG